MSCFSGPVAIALCTAAVVVTIAVTLAIVYGLVFVGMFVLYEISRWLS